MSDEYFRVGSHHTIQGIIKDAGQALDLTGATLSLKLRIDPSLTQQGTVKSLNAVPDPNQVTNKGKYSYLCVSSDFDVAGRAYLQMFVTIGAVIHKSLIVDREVWQSLV